MDQRGQFSGDALGENPGKRECACAGIRIDTNAEGFREGPSQPIMHYGTRYASLSQAWQVEPETSQGDSRG
jgi:hypothetical protein